MPVPVLADKDFFGAGVTSVHLAKGDFPRPEKAFAAA
jgi:hypothetical protein